MNNIVLNKNKAIYISVTCALWDTVTVPFTSVQNTKVVLCSNHPADDVQIGRRPE